MSIRTSEDQKRAMAREDSHGAPYARTKREVVAEASVLAEKLGARHGSVTVGTWLGARGDSYCVHLDSKSDGHRVVVHRWHSTGETTVRRVFGSWWRPAKGREGVAYGQCAVSAEGGIDAVEAAIRSVLDI